MEDINVYKLFQMKDVIDSVKTMKKYPCNEWHLNSLRLFGRKVFNYKQTVWSIEPDEGKSLNDDIYLVTPAAS